MNSAAGRAMRGLFWRSLPSRSPFFPSLVRPFAASALDRFHPSTDAFPTTIVEAEEALSEGRITAVRLTELCIQQANAYSHLRPFITLCEEAALRQAADSDRRRSEGKCLGPLDGIPYSLKDNFCVKGVRTTCASKTLEHFVPPYSATIAERLSFAGAVLIGKNNMDEFAMGSANLHSYFGDAVNPWGDGDRIAGGTSGGSAVAVAVAAGLFSIGSDTGGSVRMPASYCGVVGLKPSYGRLSRYGLVSYASSLDCPAPITRTVDDMALVFGAVAGLDERDSTSRGPFANAEDFVSTMKNAQLKGVRVGIPFEYRVEELSEDISEEWDLAAAALKSLGAEVIDVSLPYTKHALPAYYVIAPAEASSNLSRYDGVRYGHRTVTTEKATADEGSEDNVSLDGNAARDLHEMYTKTRSEGFGAEVKRRILLGTYVLSSSSFKAYFEQAQKVRRLVVRDFKRVFEEVDLLLVPSTPTEAFRISDAKHARSVVDIYANDVMTIPASLAGLPSMSVPFSVSKGDGLPIGFSLIGRPLQEQLVMRAGKGLEDTRHHRP